MLANQKQYIVNLANLAHAGADIVGELALFNKEELSAGIPIPIGFIVTSSAFDDFLIANDLIDIIGPLINDTDYTDIEEVKEAADSIKRAIQHAKVPQIIADPIAKAYGGMSGFTDAAVNLLVSPLNKELALSVRQKNMARYHLVGHENIIQALKDLWAGFFSFEALLYRNQIGYEGYLTEAVIVQKVVFSEVAGRVYTINPTDNDESIFEIQAVWGGDDGRVWDEIIPDSYYLDSENGDLIEKKIIGQEWMLIRKTKQDGKDPFIKVSVSPPMQKRPKLDERYLHQLFVYSSKILEIKNAPQEIAFNIEGGKIYITATSELTVETDALGKFPMKSGIPYEMANDDWGSKIEIIPAKEMAKLDDPEVPKRDVKAEKEFQKDLDTLVEEIQKQIPEPEAPVKFGQPVPASYIHTTVEEKTPVIPEAGKVIVDIKPLGELTSILKGRGIGEKVRFGLSHFVLEDFDLEDLTGDEVLILRDLNLKNLEVANSVRGVIVEQDPGENMSGLLKIPAIVGVKNAFETIRDNEVVTLDARTGKIFVGAGIIEPLAKAAEEPEPVTVKEEPEAEVAEKTEVAEKEVQEKPEPVETQPDIKVEPEPEFIEAPQNIAHAVPPHEGVLEQHDEPEIKIKASGVKVYDSPDLSPVNATSEFWQTVDMTDPQVDIRNTAGIVITADQLYQAFELLPEAVCTDKYAFKNYLFKATSFIKELYSKSNARSIIYQSLSLDFLKARGIEAHQHDLILVDLEVVQWLRNREGLRSFAYAFSDVLTAEHLAELKKNVSSEGMRRSATFKILAHISKPYAGMAVKSLVENGNVDGLIIDLDMLMPAMGIGFKEMDENVANFLRFVIETVNTNNCQVFLQNKAIVIDNTQIRSFLEKGLGNFIVPVEKVMEAKLQVSDQELARLIKQKKRGRKRKKIDFGF